MEAGKDVSPLADKASDICQIKAKNWRQLYFGAEVKSHYL